MCIKNGEQKRPGAEHRFCLRFVEHTIIPSAAAGKVGEMGR